VIYRSHGAAGRRMGAGCADPERARDYVVAARTAELESTGEIHQLKKTKGKDGKWRTTKPKAKLTAKPKSKAPPRCRLGPVPLAWAEQRRLFGFSM